LRQNPEQRPGVVNFGGLKGTRGTIAIAIMVGLCFVVIALLMRALALDAMQMRGLRYLEMQGQLRMDPASKSAQRELVIEIATSRLSRGGPGEAGFRYRRTA
jgi:hypothetical protein